MVLSVPKHADLRKCILGKAKLSLYLSLHLLFSQGPSLPPIPSHPSTLPSSLSPAAGFHRGFFTMSSRCFQGSPVWLESAQWRERGRKDDGGFSVRKGRGWGAVGGVGGEMRQRLRGWFQTHNVAWKWYVNGRLGSLGPLNAFLKS